MTRGTVRIDPDLMLELKRRAQRDKASLTRTLNRVLREGLRAPSRAGSRKPYRERTVSMGRPRVSLDKALALTAQLEDELVLDRLAARK